MTSDLHDRFGALARCAPDAPLDLVHVREEGRRRRNRRRLAAAVPVLALLAAGPMAAAALSAGRGTDRLVEQPANGPAIATAERLCEVAAAGYDGVVVRAEGTTVGDVRATTAPGLLGGWSDKAPDAPAARCTVDGLFPVSLPPGAPPATRGVLVATEGAAPLLLSAGPAGDPEATRPETAPQTSPPTGPTRTVTLSFIDSNVDTDCSTVLTVQRQIPQTQQVLTAALRELFRGPTAAEAARGASGFGPQTTDLLRSVKVLDGIAYLDLNSAVLPRSDFGTSCGASALIAMLRGTVTQFPTVQDFRAAIDGDPGAFVALLEGACPDPATPGDVCDPAPYR